MKPPSGRSELAALDRSVGAEKPARGWAKYRALAVLMQFASQRAMNLAFVDQVMVSAANFLAGVLLARAFGVYEFGCFALAWMFVEFIGSLQFAAIIQPMLNIGPKQEKEDGELYYHAIIAQQGTACALLAILVWIGVTLVGWLLAEPQIYQLAAPLCAVVVAYQLHTFFRRYYFARQREAVALFSDASRFSVQIAAIAALPFLWPGATAATGLWIVAGGCAISTALGAAFLGRVRWNAVAFKEALERNWAFSKWMLPSALMFWMTSQGFMLMSGLVLGAAATGSLQAALAIAGVVNILLLALDNFAPVQAARSLHVGGPTELYRYIVRLSLLTGTLTMAAIALLNVAPGYLVHLLFGHQYEGIDNLVRWLCAPMAVYAVSTVLVIWAAAAEQTRTIFVSYVAATVFTAIAAYPFTRYGGFAGVVFGSLVVEAIRVTWLLVPLVRWQKSANPETPNVAGLRRQEASPSGSAMDIKPTLYRSLLWSLSAIGVPRLMARRYAGQGGILAFHRIYDPAPGEFSFESLSVSPENLRRTIQILIGRNYRFLSMSELVDGLQTRGSEMGRYVCLTFDDGFVDNYTCAFPICREFGVPMTVYLVSGFVRRRFPMWGLGLQAVITANESLELSWEGRQIKLEARTSREKRQTYSAIASRFVLARPDAIRKACDELSARYGIDFMALSDRNALTPAMLLEMQASGLVEFGAHGVHHAYLSNLEDDAARLEIEQSKRDCEALLGTEVRHFAYPYGDEKAAGPREAAICREVGFRSAVTTESDTISASDSERLLTLPRLTYNGRFQGAPMLDLLLSGTLPRLRRGIRILHQAPLRPSLPTRQSTAANAAPETLLG
jgi:peptidoglycan/xylan/chitin deacetylase (PgdA/CDA1 family)/O-antigen/teichoic acid export membrane protein